MGGEKKNAALDAASNRIERREIIFFPESAESGGTG
jgi:hypothetical protein